MNSALETPFNETTYLQLIRELKAKTGVSLDGYRPKVAQRRLTRRARKVGCAGPEDYLEYLRKNPEEAREMIGFLTIPVGRFFRNREVFEEIERNVLPPIFSAVHLGEGITIWSAGCGEGEEIYSVAMILLERFGAGLGTGTTRLIGTDVNPLAVEKARAACYEESRMIEIPPEFRNRYFQKAGNSWEVISGIKKMVEFRVESIPKGNGVSGSDIVLMRNLLIYFDREHQDILVGKIQKCLKHGGFLVLGKSETLPAKFKGDFETVSSYNRIYRKALL